MARLTKADLNALTRGRTYLKDFSSTRVAQSDTYDIFLSHSYLDKETIQQLNYLLEDELGFSVYVDWIENSGLDRRNVSPGTAAELRSAMDRSRTLLYAISSKSSSSKWMPWELGYSDAKHGRVAVLPIDDIEQTITAYSTQEFVALYPVVEYEFPLGANKKILWVFDRNNRSRYTPLKDWLDWRKGTPLPEH